MKNDIESKIAKHKRTAAKFSKIFLINADKNKENIKQTADHIYEGHIEVAPIEYGKKRPCTFCEFKPVCHIDPIINKQDIRVLDEKIDVRQLLERGEL